MGVITPPRCEMRLEWLLKGKKIEKECCGKKKRVALSLFPQNCLNQNTSSLPLVFDHNFSGPQQKV